MAESGLAGRVILVAEDEFFVAIDFREELERLGAVVVGPASSLATAMELIGSAPRIDGAILDINLGGEMVFPAADLLGQRGVPFLFATGYDEAMIPPRFGGVLRCEKPIGSDRLTSALAVLVSKGLTQLNEGAGN